MSDPKSMVQHGYELVSRAYRADDAVDGQYPEFLDLRELGIKPGAAILAERLSGGSWFASGCSGLAGFR